MSVDAITANTAVQGLSPTQAQVSAALNSIQPALGQTQALNGNISVTGENGGPFTITFQGTLANANVTQLFPSSSSLNGGVSPPAPQVQVTPFLDGAGNTAEQVSFTGTGSTRFVFNGVNAPGVTVNEKPDRKIPKLSRNGIRTPRRRRYISHFKKRNK